MPKNRQRPRPAGAGGSPLLRRARGALAGGRIAEAAGLARQVLAAAPGDAEGMHVLGVVALREGAVGHALQLLADALAHRPKDVELLLDHAEAARASGRFDEAVAGCRRAAELAPGDARVLAGLGLACMAAGSREEGVQALRRAQELAPRVGEIAMHLASAAHETGDLDLAATALGHAARCKETALAAQLGLGGLGLARGDSARARAAFEAALRLQAGHPRAQLGLAMVEEQAGGLDKALRRFRSLVERDDTELAAWEGVARVAGALRQHEAAVQATRRLLRDTPSDVPRRVALARALLAADRLDEAEQACRDGLAGGEHVDLLVQQAHVDALRGRLDEAGTALHRALELDAGNADARNRLGEVLLQQGELQAAGECFRRALASVPGHELAWENLSLLPARLHRDTDLDAIRAALAEPPRRPMAHATLLFAQAGLLDAAGQYEAAGESLEAANDLVHERVPWDADGYRRLVASLLEVDADVLRRLAGHGHASEQPLFIVGMPRSGTTLLEQMLACHPQVHAAGEVLFFNRVRIEHDGRSYPESLRDFEPSALRELGERYLRLVLPEGESPSRVTDKLPANFLRLPLIAAVFPNARIVHLRRNAEDVGLSVYRQNFAVPEGNAWAYSLADIACYQAGCRRVMSHWRRLFGERILELDYESLVSEPEAQLRRVMAHAGLPWDAACLDFAASRRAVATASVAQVREPLHRRNVGRSGRHPRLLAALRAQLAAHSSPDGEPVHATPDGQGT